MQEWLLVKYFPPQSLQATRCLHFDGSCPKPWQREHCEDGECVLKLTTLTCLPAMKRPFCRQCCCLCAVSTAKTIDPVVCTGFLSQRLTPLTRIGLNSRHSYSKTSSASTGTS